MNTKTFFQSKTNWVALIVTLAGLAEAVDMAKLPPEVQKWAVPVVGLLVLLARNYRSNIAPAPPVDG